MSKLIALAPVNSSRIRTASAAGLAPNDLPAKRSAPNSESPFVVSPPRLRSPIVPKLEHPKSWQDWQNTGLKRAARDIAIAVLDSPDSPTVRPSLLPSPLPSQPDLSPTLSSLGLNAKQPMFPPPDATIPASGDLQSQAMALGNAVRLLFDHVYESSASIMKAFEKFGRAAQAESARTSESKLELSVLNRLADERKAEKAALQERYDQDLQALSSTQAEVSRLNQKLEHILLENESGRKKLLTQAEELQQANLSLQMKAYQTLKVRDYWRHNATQNATAAKKSQEYSDGLEEALREAAAEVKDLKERLGISSDPVIQPSV